MFAATCRFLKHWSRCSHANGSETKLDRVSIRNTAVRMAKRYDLCWT